MGTNENVIGFVIVLAIIAIGLVFFDLNRLNFDDSLEVDVVDFESCVDEGYAVMESYPRQCRGPDGEVFVEVVEERTFCGVTDRAIEGCPEIDQPVCGWSDPAKVQCVAYPCASVYTNSCFACVDENVLYWTAGSCPA